MFERSESPPLFIIHYSFFTIIMNYVILDLEFNGTYSKKRHKFFTKARIIVFNVTYVTRVSTSDARITFCKHPSRHAT